jgi:hypothetical protein
MHARFDQLLTLEERLRALPQLAAEPDGWTAVRDELARRSAAPGRRSRVVRWALAASVAMLAALVGLAFFERDRSASQSVARTQAPTLTAADPIDALKARSRALDDLLAALPSRPAVERAGTSLPIETLEAQVQWLDHQLSLGGQGGVAAREAERLWRDRVEMMNSLVQLRYVEAQHVVL